MNPTFAVVLATLITTIGFSLIFVILLGRINKNLLNISKYLLIYFISIPIIEILPAYLIYTAFDKFSNNDGSYNFLSLMIVTGLWLLGMIIQIKKTFIFHKVNTEVSFIKVLVLAIWLFHLPIYSAVPIISSVFLLMVLTT